MSRPKTTSARKRSRRIIRQARSRAKPEVRAKRRAYDSSYYESNKDLLRSKAKARYHLRKEKLDPGDLPNFRLIRPGDRIPADAGPTTKNSKGTGRASEFLIESKSDDGSWDLLFADHELRMVLGLGPPGYNREVKEFGRRQLMLLYPDRYPARTDLPTERSMRDLPPWDFRERDRRVRLAEVRAETRALTCPGCLYEGPMFLRRAGPVRASDFPEAAATLGARPADLLPSVYCPRCTAMFHLAPGTSLSDHELPLLDGRSSCQCGYFGPPWIDPGSLEASCPNCGTVVGEAYELPEPPRKPRE